VAIDNTYGISISCFSSEMRLIAAKQSSVIFMPKTYTSFGTRIREMPSKPFLENTNCVVYWLDGQPVKSNLWECDAIIDKRRVRDEQ